jgi:hypothetical protein
VDPDVSEPLVGAFEVALGAGLLLGRWMPVFVAAVALQLAGTFLVLVLRPDVAFVDGNPLRLSVEGEYVVRNLVLLAATPPWPCSRSPPTGPRQRITVSRTPRTPDSGTPTEHAA